MRLATPAALSAAAVLLAVTLSGCSGRQAVPSSSPQSPSTSPTVTLTEPAGGPTRAR